MANDISWIKFIDDVTSGHKNTEIFKTDTIKEYIQYWIHNPPPRKCSICTFILTKYNRRQNAQLQNFMNSSNSFGAKMPENILGVLFTWIFMRHIANVMMSKQEAMQLDPLSILFHSIIGCCNNIMGLSPNDLKLRKILESKILKPFSGPKPKRLTNTFCGSAKYVTKKKTKNTLCKKKQKGMQLNKKNSIKILTEYLRIFVETATQFRMKNKMYYCNHNATCIYKNVGSIDNFLDFKNIIGDNRIFVSEKWVKMALNINYHEFMNWKNFSRFQPGIYAVNKMEKKKENTDKEKYNEFHVEPVFRGFKLHTISNTEDINKKYIKDHKHQTEKLVQKLEYINSLIQIIPTYLQLKSSPVSIITKLFPLCKWCAFSIDKTMRYIINDIYVMCDERASEVCLKSTFHNEKIDDNISTTYDLGFTRSSISKCLLKSVFEDWYFEKYPFLQQFINSHDIHNEIQSLVNHQDPTKSIYCTGNRRRLHTETLTDDNSNGGRHKCFIIYVIRILQVLMHMKAKLSKERSTVHKLAWEHSIFI